MRRRQRGVSKKSGPRVVSLSDLLENAAELCGNGFPEKAVVLYEEAHRVNPNNTDIMDALAEALLDAGDPSRAKTMLLLSVGNSPEKHFQPYMYLAQLSEGSEAVAHYERGISLIQKKTGDLIDVEKEALVRAYCSVAELFLTDCCYETNAEQKCADSLNAALSIDPDNYETLQTLSSLRLSQGNRDEAKDIISKSVSIWREKDELPQYDFRVETAKILMELGLVTPEAVNVVEQILEEDDRILPAWCLLAKCFSLVHMKEQCVECLDNAMEILSCGDAEDVVFWNAELRNIAKDAGVPLKEEGNEVEEDMDVENDE